MKCEFFRLKRRKFPRVLYPTKRDLRFLWSLPTIYGIHIYPGCNGYSIRPHFLATYDIDGHPMVYDYFDCNGATDMYILRRLDSTTSGHFITWTNAERDAQKLAEMLNEHYSTHNSTIEE